MAEIQTTPQTDLSRAEIRENHIRLVSEPYLPELHEHRRADKSDFEVKTVARFEPDADNVWRFWFTDGTAFAIQCESAGGVAYMELCNVCVETEDV